ncbi:mitochondrial enolase superfamily member 1-like [Argonauta hians]
MNTTITGYSLRDIRFPTSLGLHGSDAMNKQPDYSCSYIVLKTDGEYEGHGFTFTVGRGNEIVCSAIKSLSKLVIGVKLNNIYKDFGMFWRSLTSDDQMRWIGPEKGVIHLATAAIVNALWDLWAKIEGKPLWKLLVDMEPEQLVSVIDFRYIYDALTPKEAIDLLKKMKKGKAEREKHLLKEGYPAYTTSCGWLGYPDDKIRKLCKEALAEGFTQFKAKVGSNLEDDKRRCEIIREEIGFDNTLMLDANQKWEVQEAIDWMKELAEYKPAWIEEPTSPDDIAGHAHIGKHLRPLNIGIATGEQCQNRIMFKQFLQGKAMDFCQIDSCRLGGVNENLAVILMAAKFNVPVCPHAGGVGLCELVQHLSMFDYVCASGKLRVIEYVNHLHEHFLTPVKIWNGCYQVPLTPGYTSEMKTSSLDEHEYPNGSEWKKLSVDGATTS